MSDEIYLKRKAGMWYGDNNAGYTARAELAGHYTKEDAELDEKLSSGEIKAVPVTDVLKDVSAIQKHIDKLTAVRDLLANHQPQPAPMTVHKLLI